MWQLRHTDTKILMNHSTLRGFADAVWLNDTISFFGALSSKIFPIESFTTCEKEDLCRAYCHYAKSNMSALIKLIFLWHDLQLSVYPTGLLIRSSADLSVPLKREVQPLGSVSRTYIGNVSEKFKHILNR